MFFIYSSLNTIELQARILKATYFHQILVSC